MQNSIKIAALCGSLRKDSYNKKLLHLAQTLLPENMTMGIVPFQDLPYYSEDFDTPDTTPQSVITFKQTLEKADGILIVSPEYNYAIPGALKNALDWASRGNPSPLSGKPVSLMGATIGTLGTARMQISFLSFFRLMNMPLALHPEILISQAHTKFDEAGNFTDEKGKQLIQQSLERLKQLILN
jgi:chromate reductase